MTSMRRIATASARRPRTTIALWFVFVAACLSLTGVRSLTGSDSGTGESARAHARIDAAGLRSPATETVLVRSGEPGTTAAAAAPMSRKTLGAALAVAALALAGTASADTAGNSHGSHDRAIRLVEATKDLQPTFVDTGTPGPSVGDLAIHSDAVLRENGSEAGTFRQVCTLTDLVGSPFTSTFECAGSITLNGRHDRDDGPVCPLPAGVRRRDHRRDRPLPHGAGRDRRPRRGRPDPRQARARGASGRSASRPPARMPIRIGWTPERREQATTRGATARSCSAAPRSSPCSGSCCRTRQRSTRPASSSWWPAPPRSRSCWPWPAHG